MLLGGLRTKGITKQSQENMPLITVVTVVRNGEKAIEETILSVINQTYTNVEYIIIDGTSTDKTLDIIKKYENKIDYWISEPDDGIYDAMNKGIDFTTGEWINFMNSGDWFAYKEVLEKVFVLRKWDGIDVIYGNSIEKNKNGEQIEIIASDDISSINNGAFFRHNASFVRTSVHKEVKFDLSKSSKLKFALDFNCIFSLYKLNKKFQKVDVTVLLYEEEGISSHPYRSLWYNYLILSEEENKIKEYFKFLKRIFLMGLKRNYIIRFVYNIFALYVCNYIVSIIPFWFVRKCYYKMVGLKIGKSSNLKMFQYFLYINKISIGKNTHINRKCFFNARAGIIIGNNVSISNKVSLITGSREIQSSEFSGVYKPIFIKDYVWIGVNSTILQGVIIGEGAVVTADAVVEKDVEPYSVVGGIPAKKIGIRSKDKHYTTDLESPFV